MNDASRCPRCAQPNRCAQAGSALPVGDCWCFQAPASPAARAEPLAPGPEPRCLCANCLHARAEWAGTE